MSWLRFIHFIGLTNLSDTEVESYERESRARGELAIRTLLDIARLSVLGSFARLTVALGIPWIFGAFVRLGDLSPRIVTPNVRDVMLMVIPLSMLYYMTSIVNLFDQAKRLVLRPFTILFLLPCTTLIISQTMLLYYSFIEELPVIDIFFMKAAIYTNIVSLFAVDFYLTLSKELSQTIGDRAVG
jgi:hypothetical protein